MATVQISNTPSVIVDANFAIAFCAKEPGGYAKAKTHLEYYAKNGWQFYAPGVLVAEALFVFCKKLLAGTLTSAEHSQAVQSFETFMGAVLAPPNGDASLIARGEQIRGSYGCSHSADGLYLALAEELTKFGPAEIVTFDAGLEKQAKQNAPSVVVKLIT